jgi:uncharacterized protein YbdZ (MbtH family)
MAAYESFLSRVLIEVPGCAEISAIQAIRDACIEFCEKSLVLVRDHDPVTVQQGVVDYDLEPPTGTLVIKIMQAWLDDAKLEPAAPDQVRHAALYNRDYASYQSAASTPLVYVQKDERTVSLWPVPDKTYTNGLTMRVALKPTRSSSAVDDAIFEEYAETIASGALARLMISPGKPYTNPQVSGAHRLMFGQGVNVARQRSGHGHVRSNLSVRLRRI